MGVIVMKLAAIAISLAIALPVSARAAAANEGGAQVEVTSAGLDLARTADAGLMLRRLDHAAMRVCGASSFSLREVREAVRGSACYRDSLDHAVADLSMPAVSALHRQAAARPGAN